MTKKRYSFENLSKPESWYNAGQYVAPNIPSVAFTTKPNEGYRSLHEAFEDAERGEEIVASYQKAKKTEQIRIHVEEELSLRKDLDSIKKRFDSLNQILELAPNPELSTVPTFKEDPHYPGCPRKAVGLLGEATPITLSASMKIAGTAMSSGPNRNKWGVLLSDLPKIAEKLKGVTLRLSHSSNVRDLVGVVSRSWVQGSDIKFEGVLDDEQIEKKIRAGIVNSCSIQIVPKRFRCSACKKETRDRDGNRIHDVRDCTEDAFEIAEGAEVLELSLVSDPAYSTARFQEVI